MQHPPSTMAPKIEKVVDSVQLGEGPHWDVASQSLYFVDIYGKSIHKYIPSTKKHTSACIGTNQVSLIIPVDGEKDKFLVSIGRDLTLVTWDGECEEVSKKEKIYEIDNNPETLNNRFNDGKCDSTGRLWAGSMGAQPVFGYVEPNKGSFISLGPDLQANTHLTKIGISNGLAWSLDDKLFYYIDSHDRAILQYDFDIKKGTITNCKIIFSLENLKIDGLPDGMTIDTDGNLWVAVFGGSIIMKIDPRKQDCLLDCIKLPANQVTSVAWGGPNLDELYVTSASHFKNEKVLPSPDHGATYVVKGTGSRGCPANNFKC